MEDLSASQTQPGLFEQPEKDSTVGGQGLISRGIFNATKEEIREIVLSEHEAKIEGLARFVLAKKTKEERRKFLELFEAKHGTRMADELKDRVWELSGKPRSFYPKT